MSKLIQVQTRAAIDKISTMSDRSLRLQVTTSTELPAEQETLIMQLRQKEGYFLFAETEPKLEIPDVELDVEIGEKKSPSARLRNVLYRVWENNTNKSEDFNDWYKKKMEKIITAWKDQI